MDKGRVEGAAEQAKARSSKIKEVAGKITGDSKPKTKARLTRSRVRFGMQLAALRIHCAVSKPT